MGEIRDLTGQTHSDLSQALRMTIAGMSSLRVWQVIQFYYKRQDMT